MRYYQDQPTGSIYSEAEIIEEARRSGLALKKLLRPLEPLPRSTCLLLEEAESITAQANADRPNTWFDPWT